MFACSCEKYYLTAHRFREKKREREREELWKRLHELADEIKSDKHGTPSSAGGAGTTGQQSNSDGLLNSTSTSNQNNTQAAAASSSAQSHSAGPTAISTQMNSMSISGAATVSK